MSEIQPVKKAIIPVAGLGTRMLPATKAIPKELLPVTDKPVIQHVVEEAIAAGINEIILVTRSGKEAIENHFDAHFELETQLERKGKDTVLTSIRDIIPPHVQVISLRQPEALGLGHAILCARRVVGDNPFAVMLPDVLVMPSSAPGQLNDFSNMVNRWDSSGHGQIMVEAVPNDQIHQYGIADIDGAELGVGKASPLSAMVEKPKFEDAPSNLAVVGRYVLPNQVMQLLKNTKPGAGGEIQLTDALDELLKHESMDAYRMSSITHDCGNKLGYLKANIAMGLEHPELRERLKSYIKTMAQID
ncbi:MAG: UTP--glucose-1-phosphate uridylyltransferase GalU [Porticoccaceae bacterium]|jgi:UTP--glucose-1-phosphate uridylyltransferase|nr:UTP--glucose-1-phosphate uridylyltransferase GalU [Porticoccaceae bacterium]